MFVDIGWNPTGDVCDLFEDKSSRTNAFEMNAEHHLEMLITCLEGPQNVGKTG